MQIYYLYAMKFKVILAVFSLFLSCQGPWSYYPENPENYKGIWITAYIVSGRPVKNVCLEKMHNLNEVYMRGFAFYDQASIEIRGSFNGIDTSVFLKPDTANFAHNPNCFVGDENLIAAAGKNYDMYVSVIWDSAGKKTTSEFSAKTHIPQKFKIKRAYDLLGEQYSEKDTVLYLPPPMDMRSHYFIPEYSNEDIGGALVSMIYEDTLGFYWGENSIDKIAAQFNPEGDTARHARFGDRRLLYTATNMQYANISKDIDSIPIMGLMLPAIGNIKLLFYATTREYIDYRSTFLQSNDDSRIKPIYNINGGAGIFAGMLVDTFEVNFKTLTEVKTYSYTEAQKSYCMQEDMEYEVENWRTHSECLAFWPFTPDKGSAISDLVSWCEMQYFPIEKYPDCGSAMVYFFKNGKKSPILEREVKKWCEEHKEDAEC